MVRFGPFDVDFTTSEMRKSGIRVRIQEQPLRILQALIERPGELVTREQLRDRLWPADTFVDFERSLNVALAKLRQSLNDSAEQPRYIETVARKGYRFIAPMIQPVADLQPPAAPVIPPVQPGRRSKLRWVVAGGLAAVLVILLWTVWPTPRDHPARRGVWLDLDVGNEVAQPAVSPDGMTLVFVASGRLAVRKLDQTNITPLAGTDGASSPFFSPDGQWVGYFAGHQLRKIAVEGGESVTLCDAPLDRGGAWTEDGQIIAALSASGELSSVPASGGTPQSFSHLKGERPEVTDQRKPFALPGGKGILFVSGTGIARGSLRVLPPSGGPAKTLVEGSSTGRYLASGYLVFDRGATVFIAPIDLNRLELTGPASPLIEGVAHHHFHGADFDVSASGTLVYRRGPPAANRAVTWLDSTSVRGRVLAKAGAYTSPRLSPDGKRLALTAESELWIYDLAREKLTQLTFGSEVGCCPVWSPDGDYVAFATASAVAWVRWDGSGTVERMRAAGGTSAVPWSFSPDGKWLAFHRNEPETSYDLWAAPVDRSGGTLRLGPPQQLLRQPGIQVAPAISPDGRWLAYSSMESGRPEVYVMPFSLQGPPREGKWQVSTNGGGSHRWSPNGGEIFFRTPDHHLMAVAVTGKGNSFQTDKPRVWSEQRLADVGPLPNFDVAPDGKRLIALLEAEEAKPDETHLRVLLNVDAELRRNQVIPRRAQ